MTSVNYIDGHDHVIALRPLEAFPIGCLGLGKIPGQVAGQAEVVIDIESRLRRD